MQLLKDLLLLDVLALLGKSNNTFQTASQQLHLISIVA